MRRIGTVDHREGAYFLDRLKQLQRRHRVIGDVDGLGLTLRAEVAGGRLHPTRPRSTGCATRP
jgi:4-aminobutyrate aminotransferase-like enzyme